MSSDQARRRAGTRPPLAGLLDEAGRAAAEDPALAAALLEEAVGSGLGAADAAVVRSVLTLLRAVHTPALGADKRHSTEGTDRTDNLDGAVPAPRSGVFPVVDRALVVTIDALGTMTATPDAVRDLLGYPVGEVPADGMRALVHPNDLPAVQRAFESMVRAPGSQVEVDARVRHAGGHWLVLGISMVNLLDITGINAVVAHAHNVTERRAAERALATERSRLRELVLHLAGAVVVDDGLRVIMDNAAFDRLLGTGGATGLAVAEFVDLVATASADRATTQELLAGLVRSGTPHRGVRLALADGRIATCDVVPLRAGTLWYFRDVTRETRESAARSELEETNRALEEAAALKGRFVATVSHELRTPLTAVLAFGEMLADSPEPLTAEQAGHLRVISRNAERLLRLVDDLLLLSRLETNQLSMAFTEVDVADLVGKAVEDHAAVAVRTGTAVTAEVRPGPPIHGDPARLTQVLGNVLANAIKFTPAGGAVRVSATPARSGWEVAVSDTGIGVPAADLPRLFEAFTRASNASEAGIPGSGLGLSICRQIVAAHQGSMGIESTEGMGTTVRITLPGAPR
ncbi:ATP-binding protein [Actinokineospora sp. NBRC 105648]|uniref:PAS domain-containing sensor histidine kinase n=1 Tax=Actinokineospora sp. NBRC 105648 TaxID=3032206 RepID=UPI0024A21D42|nr:ATP-binding protein [Actinokineospora sp. NBRC 105648]GLZ41375.1 hypothetical protein Acsp05_49990 [Actinokineospora sp. NBRC 105648]